MITTAHAKKESGLDDLFKGYTPQQLEEQKEVIRFSNPALQEIRTAYHKLLMSGNCYPIEVPRIALSPADIDLFLQGTIKYEDYPHHERSTSDFINQLINYSAFHGHHEFILHTENIRPLPYFSQYNCPDKRDPFLHDPFKVTIEGDGGHNFGFNEKYGYYHIKGNLGEDAFRLASSVLATIEGEIVSKASFGDTRDCTFFVHEYHGKIPRTSRHCTFKTDDEETFLNLKRNDPHEKNSIYQNHIFLVDKKYREVILAQ